MLGMMRDRYRAETCRARALAPYLDGLPAEERAYAAYAAACTGNPEGRITRLAGRILGRIWNVMRQWRARWAPWA